MTTLSRPPIHDNVVPFGAPPPRKRRFIPSSRRGKAIAAGGLTVALVAGLLGVTYETAPGGALWGVEKTIFPAHAQEVALTAVVADLKTAQEILGSGQQPTADQLSDARTALNQAKQNLEYVASSSERASMQNLYLQLTQQLLQYTPDSAQQLPALPAPPVDSSLGLYQAPDVTPADASAPTWGYSAPIQQQSATIDDFVPLPPGVPDAPAADWPQPYDPPPTPNLGYLGYYDPSWNQLYGYDRNDWYNYDLGGYNQYGYDFLGFDRWGYDRSGYDRWGYDRWGYNWSGYNWAGYDRRGWDHDGRNEWGQHRDRLGDPRDQNWYNRHHPYAQYYDWKFRNNNPVYRRTQWDRDHGFNRDRYQNWNRNRDWHNPRNRDWAPPAVAVTNINIHISSPVVNLHASLTQFIAKDRASAPLMKDLADKSPRNFTRDFTRVLAPLVDRPNASTPPQGRRPELPIGDRHEKVAPPELTAPAPEAPVSKVSRDFTAPKLAPVPAYSPPKEDHPRGMPSPVPGDTAPDSRPDRPSTPAVAPPEDRTPKDNAPKDNAPKGNAPSGNAPSENAPRHDESPAPPPQSEDTPKSGDGPAREVPAPREEPAQRAPDRAPEQPAAEPPARQEVPREHDAPQRQPAPEPPVQQQVPTPRESVPEAPVQQAAPRERPTRQAHEPQAPPQREAPREQPAQQQAPRAHEAPPRAERPAPQREAPAPRQAPREQQAPAPRQREDHGSRKAPKCTTMPMC